MFQKRQKHPKKTTKKHRAQKLAANANNNPLALTTDEDTDETSVLITQKQDSSTHFQTDKNEDTPHLRFTIQNIENFETPTKAHSPLKLIQPQKPTFFQKYHKIGISATLIGLLFYLVFLK